MIYLDSGATSLHKPPEVKRAMLHALDHCANPGRGGYGAAMEAAAVVYGCREQAGKLFGCHPEQVVFTANCTHGLNIAINTLIKSGDRVLISGFEHNAVTRPLHGLGARVQVAGRRLFDWDHMLTEFEAGLRTGVDAAVFTHVSNVFGYVLPVEQLSVLCKQYAVPFIIDAAQSAGTQPVNLEQLGAAFIAMPGHKGLLGPQGTGLLLCGETPKPLLRGGTGNQSVLQDMPATKFSKDSLNGYFPKQHPVHPLLSYRCSCRLLQSQNDVHNIYCNPKVYHCIRFSHHYEYRYKISPNYPQDISKRYLRTNSM